ncbi:MAG: DUF86 domain-containing protein [Chloroflexi bacterium]|nr:DUF86 domain-containing protein [Chloroflexota bacterium]
MSDVDAEPRRWDFYVRDMIEFCEKVTSYTNGLNQAAFVAAELTYDASLRNIELIGEAATHVPRAVRDAHPEIPWSAIIGTRNRIIHAYLGVDNDVIWTIIQDAIPTMLPRLRALLDEVEGGMTAHGA